MFTNPTLTVAPPVARRESRQLLASGLWGVAGVALTLVRPWPLAIAVDDAINGNGRFGLSPMPLLVLAGLALVACSATAGLTEMVGTVAAERAAERIGARLRHDVFDASLGLSLRWHDRTPSGELVSRLTTDVGRVLDAIVSVCSTVLADVLLLAGVLVLLVALDPQLALVGLAVVPVLLVLAVRQRRLVRAAEQRARTASGRFTARAVDLVRNVRAVQAFGRSRTALSLFGTRNARLLDAQLDAVTTEARWAPMADIVLALGAGAVLVVGGHRVLAGGLSVGGLLVVTTYLSTLYSPIRGLSRLSGVLAKSGASATRLLDVLQSRERVPVAVDPRPAPLLTADLRLRRVGFGYRPDRPVLSDFDLVVHAGESVCLFGPSGAGKSTVLHLILRLYDVDAGAVLLDGVDLRTLDPESLHRRIAFVPQDPWLLDATIFDNIAFGAERVALNAVRRAARTALVTEFSDRLPEGLDTRIGEGGVVLSGGQRRRIALARALVSSAPLLLFDEPTASLDEEAAATVRTAISAALAGRTGVLVTHDPALARLADRIVPIRTSVSRPSVDRDGFTVPVPGVREEVTT